MNFMKPPLPPTVVTSLEGKCEKIKFVKDAKLDEVCRK